MVQALEEYKVDVLEKLGELSRQMEEVNGKDKDLTTATDESAAENQELSLNVEKPADETSMDTLAKENVEESVTEDPLTFEESEPDKAEAADVPEPEVGEGQKPVTDDEVGIKLDDDELWDDGDVEEIPLFEEELLNEISQEEEKEKKAHDESESSDSLVEGVSRESEGYQDAAGEDPLVEEDDRSEEAEKEREGIEDKQTKVVEESPQAAPGLLLRILPWIVTTLSSIFIILAVFTIYVMWSGSANQQTKVIENSQLTPTQTTAKNAGEEVKIQNRPRAAQGFEAIDLAPFIIPGKSGGELVFFKLQVELVVPDAVTKQELMRRQAWLRDIIYQELKGLDISRGVQGDILGRYRTPLLKRLNMEFSPLKIQDIRLMGYLLR